MSSFNYKVVEKFANAKERRIDLIYKTNTYNTVIRVYRAIAQCLVNINSFLKPEFPHFDD